MNKEEKEYKLNYPEFDPDILPDCSVACGELVRNAHIIVFAQHIPRFFTQQTKALAENPRAVSWPTFVIPDRFLGSIDMLFDFLYLGGFAVGPVLKELLDYLEVDYSKCFWLCIAT